MAEVQKAPEGASPKKAPLEDPSKVNSKIAKILRAVQAGTMAISIATQTLASMGCGARTGLPEDEMYTVDQGDHDADTADSNDGCMGVEAGTGCVGVDAGTGCVGVDAGTGCMGVEAGTGCVGVDAGTGCVGVDAGTGCVGVDAGTGCVGVDAGTGCVGV